MLVEEIFDTLAEASTVNSQKVQGNDYVCDNTYCSYFSGCVPVMKAQQTNYLAVHYSLAKLTIIVC